MTDPIREIASHNASATVEFTDHLVDMRTCSVEELSRRTGWSVAKINDMEAYYYTPVQQALDELFGN